MSKITIRYCAYWISRFHAARVAEKIKRELGIAVDMVHGRYGEYKVLVDDETVVDGGPRVILGVFPPVDKIVQAVRIKLVTRWVL